MTIDDAFWYIIAVVFICACACIIAEVGTTWQ